jgi:hypothetical protein
LHFPLDEAHSSRQRSRFPNQHIQLDLEAKKIQTGMIARWRRASKLAGGVRRKLANRNKSTNVVLAIKSRALPGGPDVASSGLSDPSRFPAMEALIRCAKAIRSHPNENQLVQTLVEELRDEVEFD